MIAYKISKVKDDICQQCGQRVEYACCAFSMPHSDEEYQKRKNQPALCMQERGSDAGWNDERSWSHQRGGEGLTRGRDKTR